MISRKAVSPIIATILLIVVALIIVGILLSWGLNFVQRSTDDADTSIDRKCIGANIEIRNCDYNSQDENLTFIMINAGRVNFSATEELNLILIDEDLDLNSDYTDLMDGNAFNKGDSIKITITDYNANAPISVERRSTQCVNYFATESCD